MKLLWCVSLILLPAQSSVAQFRLDIRQVAEAPQDARLHTQQAPTENFLAEPRFVWAVGNVVLDNRDGSNSLKEIQQRLQAEIDLLALEYQFTETQREKLSLAGRQDLAELARVIAGGVQPNNRNDVQRIMQVMQDVQKISKAGVFADNSMMAKVAKRILADTTVPGRRRERIQFGYRSAMRLIMTELDLVTPLNRSQRTTIDKWIDDVEPPRDMLPDATYSVALMSLGKTQRIVEILSPDQRAQLQDMERRVKVGAIKPTGLIKSTKAIAGALQKKRAS